MSKFVIVTGGVLSGLGKGITAAAIGKILQSKGISVTSIKIDPYINVDAGTMNPLQHGEVFVLDDGGEVDLDLGHYERFLDINLTENHNITTGTIYKRVIEKERRGDYLGETVQVIPHVTDEIKTQIKNIARNAGADVTIVEIGGTVGDIESMPFLEAVRQLRIEQGMENVLFVHVTLVPTVGSIKEQKTKPTQHSVKSLREIGIQPDIIVCRCSEMLTEGTKSKISLFCDVDSRAVISAMDAENIYEVPLLFEKEGIGEIILSRLKLRAKKDNLNEWKEIVNNIKNANKTVRIGVVGKYTGSVDTYISIREALVHGGSVFRCRPEIDWIDAEKIEKGENIDPNIHGILVPGGFGERGIEGKIKAITLARKNKIPYLGICLGFQLAVVEYSRNVLGLEGANSTEMNPNTRYPVIDILPEQKGVVEKGGTMRLGKYPARIKKGTLAWEIYKKEEIWERHRHRYEVNPDFIDIIQDGDFLFSGTSPDGRLMEILEIKSHPFFLGTQFHPEFKSTPRSPSPIFREFIRASLRYADKLDGANN
ncbi:MAG: glutamine hydrolyzing CTP synthase [Candidatus Hydrothermarchaeota archaeon]